MLGPFKLNSPVGRSYNTNVDDVQRLKRALLRLGFYEAPRHGITPYPDTALFHAIETFQREHGLRKDGVMKPGGETETGLKVLKAYRDRGRRIPIQFIRKLAPAVTGFGAGAS